MRNVICLCLCVFASGIYSGKLQAQDFDYHPALSDDFLLVFGVFRSDNSLKIAAEGINTSLTNNEIDFSNSIGVDKNSTLFNGQLRWKFGKQSKWSLFGQYFSVGASGKAVLAEDVGFQDNIFRAGTFVGAGVDIAITRVFVGRSLVKNQQHDFGVGIGLHDLDLNVFIEGEIRLNDANAEFRRVEASNSQPLPNAGLWYNVSPARKWLIHTRVDWISASIGDYDGTLWNTLVGVNYQAFRHVGIDLSYQFFKLNLDINKSNWMGGVDMRYSGPVLAVTANW